MRMLSAHGEVSDRHYVGLAGVYAEGFLMLGASLRPLRTLLCDLVHMDQEALP